MPVTIAGVALDCNDVLLVAGFWSAALDRPLDAGASPQFASIGFTGRRMPEGWHPAPPDGQTWIFAKVPEPKQAKNRLHLDVITPDAETEIARLIALGARRVEDRAEYGFTWTLMTDPEGNEFDLAAAL